MDLPNLHNPQTTAAPAIKQDLLNMEGIRLKIESLYVISAYKIWNASNFRRRMLFLPPEMLTRKNLFSFHVAAREA